MRLKYYLRGAGVGVLVTTLIFVTVLAFSRANKPTTDDQIIADAMALGMVFPDNEESKIDEPGVIPVENNEASVSDATLQQNESVELETPTDNEQLAQTLEEIKNLTDAAAAEQANLDAQRAEGAEEKKTEDVKTDTTAETKKEEEAVVTSTAEKIAFSVGGGDSSYDVAKNLVKQGLVQDALAYDRYLEQNGYDRKLKTGTFYLDTNMSEEEIAQVLIGKNRTTSPVQ